MRSEDRAKARNMRQRGASLSEIAKEVKAGKGLVSLWVRDVKISDEAKAELVQRQVVGQMKGSQTRKHAQNCRDQREKWREEGKRKAREGDAFHAFVCALYWGEGAKSKNSAQMSNSDINVLRSFIKFLKKYFEVKDEDLTIKLIAYTDCLPREEVEKYWEDGLSVPGAKFGPHEFDSRKYITRGNIKKRNRRIQHGTCYVIVKSSTRILQHIYGALSVYGESTLNHHGEHSSVIREVNGRWVRRD